MVSPCRRAYEAVDGLHGMFAYETLKPFMLSVPSKELLVIVVPDADGRDTTVDSELRKLELRSSKAVRAVLGALAVAVVAGGFVLHKHLHGHHEKATDPVPPDEVKKENKPEPSEKEHEPVPVKEKEEEEQEASKNKENQEEEEPEKKEEETVPTIDPWVTKLVADIRAVNKLRLHLTIPDSSLNPSAVHMRQQFSGILRGVTKYFYLVSVSPDPLSVLAENVRDKEWLKSIETNTLVLESWHTLFLRMVGQDSAFYGMSGSDMDTYDIALRLYPVQILEVYAARLSKSSLSETFLSKATEDYDEALRKVAYDQLSPAEVKNATCDCKLETDNKTAPPIYVCKCACSQKGFFGGEYTSTRETTQLLQEWNFNVVNVPRKDC